MKRDRLTEKLIDIGTTTALSAMVEIVEAKRAGGAPGGILARQAAAMVGRIPVKADYYRAMEAFLDELQLFIESVPGARTAQSTGERTGRRSGRAA
jgi:hypothetical protein